jgi:hypothetical protein
MSDYEAVSSPYRLDTGKPFKMTPEAAKTLCQLIRETPEIDGLIIGSQPSSESANADIEEEREIPQERLSAWAQESFDDAIAKILARDLPAGRFKMLQIAGGFGNEGARALAERLPALLTHEPIDPKDILVSGLRITDAAVVTGPFSRFLEERQTTRPGSLVNRRDPCVIS